MEPTLDRPPSKQGACLLDKSFISPGEDGLGVRS